MVQGIFCNKKMPDTRTDSRYKQFHGLKFFCLKRMILTFQGVVLPVDIAIGFWSYTWSSSAQITNSHIFVQTGPSCPGTRRTLTVPSEFG